MRGLYGLAATGGCFRAAGPGAVKTLLERGRQATAGDQAERDQEQRRSRRARVAGVLAPRT